MIRQASILLLLLGIGACARSTDYPLPESIARLDSLLLESPTSSLGEWLLVGRFEVTREEYGVEPDRSSANIPLVMVSFIEASAWCEERGLRLPSFKEWQYLADNSGRSAVGAGSTHNGLALNLDRPLPVGVFERGRTPLGAYDFFGNVREWTFDAERQRYFACGGSFASRDASTAEWEQLELEATDRAEDVGFRYVTGAVSYFHEQVIPYWAELDTQQRAELALIWSEWSPSSRAALSLRLLADGAPKDFCQLLSGS